jgi:N-acetylmuramoyl-L-alanine amidase
MNKNNRQNRSKKNPGKRRHPLRNILAILLCIAAMAGLTYLYRTKYLPEYRLKLLTETEVPDYVDEQILSFDSNSRSGESLENFKSIVIHYVANPGSTAQGNHDYFANPESDVSSHFVIGLDGEIIQCLPLYEKSAASNWRNNDTISIEVCHPDETGKFNDATYNSLVKLTSWLVSLGNLKPKKDIIRHYDITGKICPKYFVDNPDAWDEFKNDVANYKKMD